MSVPPMRESRETELKYRLRSGADFLTLRSRLPAGTLPVRQTSDFFDASDLRLSRAGVCIRVRREVPLARSGEARILLTIKEGGVEGPGLFRARERSRPLTLLEWREIRRNPDRIWRIGGEAAAELAARFGTPPLEGIGTLSVERHRFRPEPDLPVELDRIIYPDGHEEYEIEIETDTPERAIETDAPERAAARLTALLADLGVQAVPEGRTKLERLLGRLRGPGALSPSGGPDGGGGGG